MMVLDQSVGLHATKPGNKNTKRSRSRVSDPTGPTPVIDDEEVGTVRIEDIPEMNYNPDKHPIPHQPWRRGETAGCEAPIDAEWRQRAEAIIKRAVEATGGTVVDVTWFLTFVVITIEDEWDQIPRDILKSDGPVIDVEEQGPPLYYDPADPNPEDIWADEDDIVYQRDEEQEEDLKSKMYARAEEGEEGLGLDEEGDVSLYASQETREDDAVRVAEEAEANELKRERPLGLEALKVDSAAISIIAGAIVDALETVEEELNILARHEIILTSPGLPGFLETQKEFDAHRGDSVAVETQDPWESNRTLQGKLVDRNSMDIIINKQGRMVTIPLNFVKCVRLLRTRSSDTEMDLDMEDTDVVEEYDIYED